tara:strand:- start:267 stop:497 length:231 start_codon:yes stop_codon:yes gene_type:complete
MNYDAEIVCTHTLESGKVVDVIGCYTITSDEAKLDWYEIHDAKTGQSLSGMEVWDADEGEPTIEELNDAFTNIEVQ